MGLDKWARWIMDGAGSFVFGLHEYILNRLALASRGGVKYIIPKYINFPSVGQTTKKFGQAFPLIFAKMAYRELLVKAHVDCT